MSLELNSPGLNRDGICVQSNIHMAWAFKIVMGMMPKLYSALLTEG